MIKYIVALQQFYLIIVLKDNNGVSEYPLSLGPPHMTRWRDRVAVTAAPDDMNRIVVIKVHMNNRQLNRQ